MNRLIVWAPLAVIALILAALAVALLAPRPVTTFMKAGPCPKWRWKSFAADAAPTIRRR